MLLKRNVLERIFAGDLAIKIRREPGTLKSAVGKLKHLGLTESLHPGYRLSPRGRGLLKRLNLAFGK